MKNRTAILIGIILIIVGAFSIIDSIFGVNLWSLIFPLILIALGVFILFRPKSMHEKSNFILRFINENDKNQPWTIASAEYLSFVSDLELDLSQAIIPDGETTIRFNSFVNDLDITLPADAGFKLKSHGFVSETKINGHGETTIFTPYEYESPDYHHQSKKICVQTTAFVSD
ncbi:MAG TPA: LiaF domain-containing protein, partial [Anaerolineaceae bacterium]|nr:LiaF domain-containing protein [Anaerolineaceae bacterium]